MIVVQHRNGQYPIEFLELADVRSRLVKGHFVVTDQNVAGHWGATLGDSQPTLVLRPGERTKSFAMLEEVTRWLARSGATRRSKVVALGGGVIGDLAGLAAATYMRGVELIQVPTTLLAQVDASVGGKVGIDLPEGKNLVGAFHAPFAVWIPLEVLSTLPEREFVNGAAEVWKYAFAVDSALLSSLESHPLQADSPKLKEVIERCIDLKRQIVEQDERDERGIRAVLNFGHTVGHALERASDYESFLHGEAISIGMAVEARISEDLDLCPAGIADQIDRRLSGQGLPVRSELLKDGKSVLSAMRTDKKAEEGRLAFSLLTGLGACKLVTDVPDRIILRAIERTCRTSVRD